MPTTQDSQEDEANENSVPPVDDNDSDFDSEGEDDAPVPGEQTRRNFDFYAYKYSVQQSNSDLKPSNEAQDLTIRKLQYVTGEILNDLGIKKLELYTGTMTLIVAFSVLWIRMIIHYLGQYVLLKAMDAPVIDVTLKWYKIYIEYSYWFIG